MLNWGSGWRQPEQPSLLGTGLSAMAGVQGMRITLAEEPHFGLYEGDRVAGYLILEELKMGAVTEVYRALDERTGREVILKRLASEADEIDRSLFEREVSILRSLDHPRIPRAGALFEASGSVAFTLDRVPGETLKEELDRQGPFSREQVIQVLQEVLSVLAYLHGQTPVVLHRDLKPQNLLRSPGGVMVLDFGIARRGLRAKLEVQVPDLTRAHTVGYAPPEQSIGLEAFPQSDLYALAATALYLWTGEHPIRHWDAASGRMRVPHAPDAGLAGLLDWMLVPGVAERCPSAERALEALRGLPPV